MITQWAGNPLGGAIGRKVCFTNVQGLKRYAPSGHPITTVSADGELVQVAWEAWPEYLASLPHPNEAGPSRRGAIARPILRGPIRPVWISSTYLAGKSRARLRRSC